MAPQLHEHTLGLFPPWTEYIVTISGRFSELYDDPLAELVSLKQGSDSVINFLDKFETARMRITIPEAIPEAHAISIFLANLNIHLSLHTRQFEFTTIAGAARIAMLHESSLHHTPSKNPRAPFNPSQKPTQPYYNKNPTNPPLLPTPTNQKPPPKAITFPNQTEKPPRKFSYQKMQDRRAKGLCMFCDEVYTPGHSQKHKRSQIFVMECEDDDGSVSSDTEDELAVVAPAATDEKVEDTPVISVNTLNGSSTFNCMRVIGQCGKRKLYILIDNGRTHNFLELNVAIEMGCLLEQTKPMAVTTASGTTMVSRYKCSNFQWRVQGYNYSSEIRTLPLDGCDLVLGVQWLCTLGPILWDFLNPRMEFILNGSKNVLRGVTKNGYKVIKGSSFNKLMLQAPQIAMLQVVELPDESSPTLQPEALLSHISASGDTMESNPDLLHLLEDFTVLFEDPSELPPFREGFDHRIPLETGANPVNLRPCRYSTL